jgi:hypothetical protein
MKFNEYLTEVSRFQLEQYGVIKAIEHTCKPFLKEFRNTGLDRLIWRGTSKRIKKAIAEITPRKNRLPKDMPEELHDMLDDEFYRKFKWRPRSEGVFTTSNKITAEGYGSRIVIFVPVGEYEYVYNVNISDLYTDIGEEWSGGDIGYLESEWSEEWSYRYGNKGSEFGSWYYEGADLETQDLDDALEIVAMDIGEKPSDTSDFEWVPEMEEDEFIKQRKEEFFDEQENRISSVIRGYTDLNLKKGVNAGVEIMFNCKTYYIIERLHEKSVLNFLKTGQYPFDERQIEFAFEKDPEIRKNIKSTLKFIHKQPKYMTWKEKVSSTAYKKKKELEKKYKMGSDSWGSAPSQKKLNY